MLIDKPAPLLTSQSWVVMDQDSREVLFGKFEAERREVASLTKIMTIYTVLNLIDRTVGIDLNERVTVDPSVTEVIGTTANLLPGDSLSINELLYGLMLPSGNDAAHMLAMHFGAHLLMEQRCKGPE
jgi:serine-type D-Ala-D-Ala carboxypeptidase (penicillin-binding protein 5/6)